MGDVLLERAILARAQFIGLQELILDQLVEEGKVSPVCAEAPAPLLGALALQAAALHEAQALCAPTCARAYSQMAATSFSRLACSAPKPAFFSMVFSSM